MAHFMADTTRDMLAVLLVLLQCHRLESESWPTPTPGSC